jgi:TetR/AcrR family transcriptional regulator, transcriptional repressor for nem operon
VARPKEFEPDVALDRAMDLFWRRGYHATSIGDLTEHLGIARASLYATFGSKHDLYVAALRRYQDTRDPDPIGILKAPGPALPALRLLVERSADPPPDDPDGCLMTNAAAECEPEDSVVMRLLTESWDEFEAAIADAIRRGQDDGEIPADGDPRSLARLLLVLMQGLQLLNRCDDQTGRLRDAADQAIALLTR